jgi:dTDP-4-dehydrorhamnose reductase
VILLTGGSGQVGTAIRSLLPAVKAPDRAGLDLSRPHELADRLAAIQPSAIINCAAFTAVDRAEDEPELAMVVNAKSVARMAEYSARAEIPFVTFSTDYVFDGTASTPYVESSATAPINAYGCSKEEGERAALLAYPATLVIRTSWVVSATHRNFVTAILERAADGAVNVVSDQSGCPTFAPDLAAATIGVLETGVSGILHITNHGATTWYEFARTACSIAGIDPDRIRPIGTNDYPTKARRPRYSVLGSERAFDLQLRPLREWEDALRALIDDLPQGK